MSWQSGPCPSVHTLTLSRTPVVAAEASLASAQRQPQCLVSVLGLLTQEPVPLQVRARARARVKVRVRVKVRPNPNPKQVPLQVRQAAAVFFKNVVRRHWEPEVSPAPTLTRTLTRTLTLTLTLTLSLSLTLILARQHGLLGRAAPAL